MFKQYLGMTILSVAVSLVVLSAFYISNNPPAVIINQQHDLERVQDFQTIYSSIAYQNKTKDGLAPDTLSRIDINPEDKTDPQTKESYTYKKLSDSAYEICATFSTDTRNQRNNYEIRMLENNAHEHPQGFHCVTYTLPPK
jgi:hypothetical protein